MGLDGKHVPGRRAGSASAAGRSARPRVPFAVLVTVLLVGGLALLLALNTASAANELRRHALASRDDGVSNRLQVLRNEVAASAAPANLAAAAAQLGMVPDGGPAFLVPDGHGGYIVRGKPGYATAAPLVQPTQPHRPATHSATSSSSASRSAKPSGTAKPSSTAKPSKTAKPHAHPSPTNSTHRKNKHRNHKHRNHKHRNHKHRNHKHRKNRHRNKKHHSTKQHRTDRSTPSSTPTPTVTLPGGDR